MYPVNVNWKDQIALIAGPYGAYERREAWLYNAVKATGLPFSVIKTLFYEACKNPKWDVGAVVLNAADQSRITQAKKAQHELAGILANAANALERIDPDFHRATIDDYRAFDVAPGSQNRT